MNSSIIDVKVPDIGDFSEVPVIEIFVKVGDTLAADDPICTLESDKATMDIPAPQAGTVKTLCVTVGNKVAEGALLLQLETQTTTASTPAATASPKKSPLADPENPPISHSAPSTLQDADYDLIVLGAGPGGYSAAFRAADLGLKTAIIERYSTLGGVCLNVGCIPSKALLHTAEVIDEARHLHTAGIQFAPPEINLEALRQHKTTVVQKLTGGLAGMAKARKIDILRGYGHFLDTHHLEVEETTGVSQDKTGQKTKVSFRYCIIAAGSAAVHLPFLPEDPRIVDATGALNLPTIPAKMLIIGGGIIGLEMATVYATLGASIDVVEMGDKLMQGPDRDAVKVWEKQNSQRLTNTFLQTKTVACEAKDDGLWISFDGKNAPTEPQRYDLILQSAGRRPNGHKIGLNRCAVAVDEQGFILVDTQMRTNIGHIFAIGDIIGQPMLAHKAVHEGHVAAEVIAGELQDKAELARQAFDATVIPGVAYTNPEVAWVGYTEAQAKTTGKKIRTAKFPWAASGRAIANGAEYGFSKLIFDQDSGRIIGGSIVGPNAGDMIGEICLAIEMGADDVDISKTIHPHPTLGESIGMAAEVAHGSCTDLPPARKR